VAAYSVSEIDATRAWVQMTGWALTSSSSGSGRGHQRAVVVTINGVELSDLWHAPNSSRPTLYDG